MYVACMITCFSSFLHSLLFTLITDLVALLRTMNVRIWLKMYNLLQKIDQTKLYNIRMNEKTKKAVF